MSDFTFNRDYAFWDYNSNLSGYVMTNPVIFKYNGDYNIFVTAMFLYYNSSRVEYEYIFPFTNNLTIVNKYKYYATNHSAHTDGIENYINYIYGIDIQSDPNYELIRLNSPKDLVLWCCENLSTHTDVPIYKNDSIISYTNNQYVEADPYSPYPNPEYGYLKYNTSFSGAITSNPAIFKYNGKYNIFIMPQLHYGSGTRASWNYVFPLTDNLKPVNLYKSYAATISRIDPEEFINYIYGITIQNDPNYEVIPLQSAFDLIPWIFNNMILYNNDPIYKDCTKINYTDQSYEVVDGVLTENQAKYHAYQNLLNSYGTFYKATEQEITEYYNR